MTGRNDLCPCGSGRKFKHCCLHASPAPGLRTRLPEPPRLLELFRAGRLVELEAILTPVCDRDGDSFHWGLLGTAMQMLGKDGVPALQEALRKDPGNLDAQNSLGIALRERGRIEEAIACLRAGLSRAPRNLPLKFNLGDSLRLAGAYGEAADVFRSLLAEHPDLPEASLCFADVLMNLGHLEEADAVCRNLLKRAPDHAQAHFCLGGICRARSNLGGAKQHLEQAVRLAPDFAAAYDNLGCVLQELGMAEQAILAHRKSMQLAPLDPNPHLNLGRLHLEANRFVDALPCYREACRLQPEQANTQALLGQVLHELGKTEEARAHYAAAIKLAPDRLLPLVGAAIAELPTLAAAAEEAAQSLIRFDNALGIAEQTFLRAAKHVAPEEAAGIRLPFLLAYRGGSHVERLSRFGDLLAACTAEVRPARSVAAVRSRTRLLIVTHHVRRHSVWDIVLKGLLSHLDRQRFEVVLYHLGVEHDAETALGRSLVDVWRGRETISGAQGWVDAALADAPDVVFYPELGMSSIAAFLAAHRLAPLQLAGWGHPITSGMPTIDGFLTGDLLESASADAHYRETLLRLPGTGCCTHRDPVVAAVAPELDDTLAAIGGPKLLIAQRAIKIDPSDDDVFARIAAETGDAGFVLCRDPIAPWATDRVVQRMRASFARHGAGDTPILVVPWLSEAKFVSLLERVDLFLDCPNFSGYTTAWQALHQGVPIVTREGTYLRQRLASGLLRQAQLTGFVAPSVDEYVALAGRLIKKTRDAESRALLRQQILEKAALVDGNVDVVRAFESIVIDQLGRCRTKAVSSTGGSA